MKVLAGHAKPPQDEDGQDDPGCCKQCLFDRITSLCIHDSPYRAACLIAFHLKKAEILTIPFFFEVRIGDEAKGRGVDAIPQARRLGTVTENVTQVGIPMLAAHLGSRHKK